MSLLDEIRNQILENKELDINEKMCLISLMCIGETIGFELLADCMGVKEVTAEMAFLSLKSKGYFAQDDPVKDNKEIEALKKFLKRETKETDNIIKNGDVPKVLTKIESETEMKFDKNETSLNDVDRVMNLVEETLTRSEASIILGFAGGDFNKVEAMYAKVRNSQMSDKIDALVNLLQSKDEKTMRNKSKIMSYKNNLKNKNT